LSRGTAVIFAVSKMRMDRMEFRVKVSGRKKRICCESAKKSLRPTGIEIGEQTDFRRLVVVVSVAIMWAGVISVEKRWLSSRNEQRKAEKSTVPRRKRG